MSGDVIARLSRVSVMSEICSRKYCHVLLVAGLLLLQPVAAQPVRDRLLDTLEIAAAEDGFSVLVRLTVPVRYVRHFPYDSGAELRIRIRPFNVGSSDREALFRRETLVPHGNDDNALAEVVYEGDIEGGPYLTLTFSRCVEFTAGQGRDSRSIVVQYKDVMPDHPVSISNPAGQ